MGCTHFDRVAWLYPIVGFLGIKNKFYENIKQLSKPNKNYIALDVGGGTGIIAELLAKDIKKVIVLDPSKNMLEKIKSKKIDKVLGSAENIKFKDKTFDLVYCVDSFHHFTNGSKVKDYNKITDKCIKELLRVLKPKGQLLLIEFDNESGIGKLIEFFENRMMKWGSKFYSPKSLKELLSKYSDKIEGYRINSYCYTIKAVKK